MNELPSQVKDMNFIRIPEQDKVAASDDEWNRCGKWILHNRSGTMSWIDETWTKLQILVENGSLLMMKASTAAMYERGFILCYTRPGVEEIERAAKEIRKRIHYEKYLYYKINSETENKIDRNYGHKHIAQYMHSFKGYFYRSYPELGWILVNNADRENQRETSLKKLNITSSTRIVFDQLPSRSKEIYLTVKNKNIHRRYLNETRFSLTCSIEEEENNLSEADRLWIFLKKLMDEAAIHKITCKKNPLTAKFHLHYNDELDIDSAFKLCDKILEDAQIFRFIYIFPPSGGFYRYSPEKEFEYYSSHQLSFDD